MTELSSLSLPRLGLDKINFKSREEKLDRGWKKITDLKLGIKAKLEQQVNSGVVNPLKYLYVLVESVTNIPRFLINPDALVDFNNYAIASYNHLLSSGSKLTDKHITKIRRATARLVDDPWKPRPIGNNDIKEILLTLVNSL